MIEPLDVFAHIARQAGAAILAARGHALEAWVKADNEPVTTADRAAHGVLMRALHRHFPGVPLLTEESTSHHIPDGPFIVVDELDGTVPFAAGTADWGVLLALVDGEPTLGVIHLPEQDVTITAARGRGCRLNGRSLSLSAGPGLSETLLGVEINGRLGEREWAALRRVCGRARAVRATACTAASAHELLKGTTNAYINLSGGRIWDFAAPALAISEAGGCVADRDGEPLRWNELHTSFLAACDAQLLRALADALRG